MKLAVANTVLGSVKVGYVTLNWKAVVVPEANPSDNFGVKVQSLPTFWKIEFAGVSGVPNADTASITGVPQLGAVPGYAVSTLFVIVFKKLG